MIIYMQLSEQDENTAIYKFGDGSQTPTGILKIDKHDIDNSKIIAIPENNSVTPADIKKCIAKAIRTASNNTYPREVYRVT